MHNRDKYPAIWAEKEKAEAELAGLMAERTVHTDQIAVIQGKIDKLQAEKVASNGLAMKDASRIGELKDVISRCAIAMGAVRAGQK